jgi:hypothetical protein
MGQHPTVIIRVTETRRWKKWPASRLLAQRTQGFQARQFHDTDNTQLRESRAQIE